MSLVVGVFVGGRSSRMGGSPKGLLAAPDTGESLVARAVRIARSLTAEVVLVGEASAYREVAPEVPSIADDPVGIGPLGGLNALFKFAGERPVIALACDMPFITLEALCALRDAPSTHACVAAQSSDRLRWEPFFARYDAPRARLAAEAMFARKERSLQRLIELLGPVEVPVAPTLLADWDTPHDVALSRSRTP